MYTGEIWGGTGVLMYGVREIKGRRAYQGINNLALRL